MVRKAKIEEVNEINLVFEDAKALFRMKGSTQWQDLDGYPNINTINDDIINDRLYVKEVDNRIAGVIALSREEELAYKEIYEGCWLNTEEYYVIHRLAVSKDYYARGIAKELMLAMETETIKDNIYNIKVDTMENNLIMTNLLRDLGYHTCGVIYLLRKDVIEKKRIGFQKVLKRQF